MPKTVIKAIKTWPTWPKTWPYEKMARATMALRRWPIKWRWSQHGQVNEEDKKWAWWQRRSKHGKDGNEDQTSSVRNSLGVDENERKHARMWSSGMLHIATNWWQTNRWVANMTPWVIAVKEDRQGNLAKVAKWCKEGRQGSKQDGASDVNNWWQMRHRMVKGGER